MAKEAPEELPGMNALNAQPYGRVEIRQPLSRESGVVLNTRDRKVVKHVVLDCGY